MVKLGARSLMLTVKVDTPVFVWGGSRLTRDIDFVVQGGRIYLIDFLNADIPDNILQQRDAMSAIRNYVLSLINRPRGLPNFVKAIDLVGNECGNELMDLNPEGLPASEVKGMLRTAYLYHVLRGSDDARNALLRSVEDALKSGRQPKYFDSAVMSKVFWRSLSEHRGYNVFNRVVVRRVGANYSTAAYCLETRHLDGKPVASTMALGIKPGSEFRFEVLVREDSPGLTLDELVNSLREFSSDLVIFERGRGVYVPNCAVPVRVGFGSGRRWKTVLNLLQQWDGKLFAELTKYMSRGKLWGDSTIKLAGGKPVGWVCLDVQH